MEQVTERIFVETGFRGCNVGYLVTSDGVVMIDTPQVPVQAVAWRKEVQKAGPLRYLINTEPHRDHFYGNCYFDCPIIAHEGVREAIAKASLADAVNWVRSVSTDSMPLMESYSFRLPDITFSDNLTLHCGGHTLKLITLPGHTAYEAAVFIPEENVVFASDNVMAGVQAWLHESLPYAWLESMGKLSKLGARIIVPGHGKVSGPECIDAQSRLIELWINEIKAAKAAGLTQEEAAQRTQITALYPMHPGVEHMSRDLVRMNIARLYKVL